MLPLQSYLQRDFSVNLILFALFSVISVPTASRIVLHSQKENFAQVLLIRDTKYMIACRVIFRSHLLYSKGLWHRDKNIVHFACEFRVRISLSPVPGCPLICIPISEWKPDVKTGEYLVEK